MGSVQLYIAQSLDGFIADRDGGVAWLEAFLVEGVDYGYPDFLARVGAVVMGATTYEQELARGEWPYGARPAWVFTHRALATPPAADVRFVQGPPAQVVDEIEAETGENVFLVGGGRLAREFLEAGLIDELILFLAPVVLGDGIPLFQGAARAGTALVGTKPYATGLVELRYRFA